jgi:hypothetical protein
MSKTVPQFTEGELVNVSIKGARVVDGIDAGELVLRLGAHAAGNAREVVVPLPYAGVTIERAAPAEWPPQPGDLWEDRNHNLWFTSAGSITGTIAMCADRNLRGSWSDPAELLDAVGPMRLAYRRGWTPATQTTPAAPDPARMEAERRAEVIAGLRALADLLEARPELGCNLGQIIWDSGLDELPAWAEILGGQIKLSGYQQTTHHTVKGGRLRGLDLAPYHIVDKPYAAPEPIDPDPRESAYTEPGDAERTAVVEEDAAERAALEREAEAELDGDLPAIRSTWTCAYCPFTTNDADAGLAHIADHEAGRATAMTDAQLAAAYDQRAAAELDDHDGPVDGCECEDCAAEREGAEALPHRVPDGDAPVVGEVGCGAQAQSCWCALAPGHDGPHECGREGCGGSWLGSIDSSDFEVVRLPDISQVLGGAS